MALRRFFEVVSVQVCYNCFLYLLPVIHRTEAIAITTPDPMAEDNYYPEPDDEEKMDMIKGMAAGFGFFFGLVILVCLVWCFCCTNVCSKKGAKDKRNRSKVSPSPPHSASVRTRSSAASSP